MVEKDSMLYRNLGNSGLKVSAISIGNGPTTHTFTPEEVQFQVLSKLIEAGVNFIDTSECYGSGDAETILGNAIKRAGWDRDELVISTKFFQCGGSSGLSRKRLIQAMKNSLARLQLNYVDVMFLHRYDHETPLEETIRAVNHLIEKGKASYWGTSEFSSQQLMESYKICEKYGYEYPVAEQCQYSMLVRENLEVTLTPFFDRYGLGATVWSPLAGGILSGKYNSGEIPEGLKYSDPILPQNIKARYDLIWTPKNRDHVIHTLKGLDSIATDLGITQTQLCLAWTIKNKDVSTAITGATHISQVEDKIKALDALDKLDNSTLDRIEKLLANRPSPPTDFRSWTPRAPRR
jgi:voltage-dependent potassium channel beta subunit